MRFQKIINDPVHGFITIDHPLILELISHPYYQRLRRIQQMAMAQLVYPGAVHTRLHHSLGAYHLMRLALQELKAKGIDIHPDEQLAAEIAILLHDIGHGPFSHALEQVLSEQWHHEELSLMMMRSLNELHGGKLDLALQIFTKQHPKKFLSQLISGQLDVDRMDYLSRDSFFTGVHEGVIASDRIIQMLTVQNGELMVEEKGIYSIEKFLVARRLMYWQVYFHKTVVSAEQMLQRVIKRARLIGAKCDGVLHHFIHPETNQGDLESFCQLDDMDVMMAIKQWCKHPDKVLSFLCNGLMHRNLLKVKLSSEPIDQNLLEKKREEIKQRLGINEEEAQWLVFQGEATSSLYNFEDEQIRILFKDGSVRDISEVDDALIHANLQGKVKKQYICYPGQ